MPYDKVLQENIEFSELEEETVNLKEFEKLKHVKQNGFSYVLYPYAQNNRYDHSIGTMYWATHLYKSLMNQNVPIENDALQAIRLAGLIHDIGHGPFSHSLELLIERNSELLNYKPWNELRTKFGNRKPHELLTLNFMESKNFVKLVPKETHKEVIQILKKESPLSVIISGDLDADRLDYLTRDSHHSGLPFGLNVKPIFNELIQQNLKLEKVGTKYFLQILSSGVPAFEQLLMARYSHYCYIAYEPKILQANLTFVSALEKSLWESYKQNDEIALAVFYIFTELTDDKLLDLNFSDVDKRKKKVLSKIKKSSLSETFENLKSGNIDLEDNFVRLCSLGKELTFNFFKDKTTEIRSLENIVSKVAAQPIKILFNHPEALTTNTCVYDEDIHKRYCPAFLYDYSPVVRALEQKMYLDCGVIISSVKYISHSELIGIFEKVSRPKADFDVYSFAILKYIQEIKKSFPSKEWKWLLRRSRIFEFLKKFVDSSYKDGLVKGKIKFVTTWYSEEAYEILQKLEFLDAINEDFNISLGNGFIPCYVYSIGEFGEDLLKLLNLTTKERDKIETFIKRYVERRRNHP